MLLLTTTCLLCPHDGALLCVWDSLCDNGHESTLKTHLASCIRVWNLCACFVFVHWTGSHSFWSKKQKKYKKTAALLRHQEANHVFYTACSTLQTVTSLLSLSSDWSVMALYSRCFWITGRCYGCTSDHRLWRSRSDHSNPQNGVVNLTSACWRHLVLASCYCIRKNHRRFFLCQGCRRRGGLSGSPSVHLVAVNISWTLWGNFLQMCHTCPLGPKDELTLLVKRSKVTVTY